MRDDTKMSKENLEFNNTTNLRILYRFFLKTWYMENENYRGGVFKTAISL